MVQIGSLGVWTVLGLSSTLAFMVTERPPLTRQAGRVEGDGGCRTRLWQQSTAGDEAQVPTRLGRDAFLQMLSATLGGVVAAAKASAQEPIAAANLPADVLAEGVVTLGKGTNVDRMGEATALYVTARVGARGPVLASIRVPQPSFPLEFRLKEGDVYASSPEEQHELAESIRTQDLVISARLDKDGTASTRDPEDLVGQGRVFKFGVAESSQWSRALLELTGRGAFGEFVTQQQKKQ